MSFNYNKGKHHDGDSMWTSYSDLFLGLSIVFLLLYVTASLKQGTDGIQKNIEYKQVLKENADLKQQIQAYESLKSDYLQHQASADEQSSYEELMGKLNLLQDQAKDEKNKLRQQATENEQKEHALNKYQQLIRNIVNSNMVSKSRIKNRDTMIDTKEQVITEKAQEISGLEKTVQQKKAEVSQGEQKIAGLEDNLTTRMKQLRNSYKSQKISQAKYEKQKMALKQEAEAKIEALRQKNMSIADEIRQANQQLQATSARLNDTQSKLSQTKGALVQAGAEKERLKNEMTEAASKHQSEVARMRGQFESQQAQEKAAFEGQLAKERLSGAQKAAREASFKAAAEAKARGLEQQVADLDGKFKETEGKLNQTQGALAQAGQERERLQGELAGADAKRAADAANLRSAYAAKAAADKAAFEEQLAKERLSGDQKAAREASFKAAAEGKAKALEQQVSALGDKYKASQGELAQAQENLNARKKLAGEIAKNFAARGVKAEVDARTGDVMLSFGNQYFGSGQSNLKEGMTKILDKAVPAYSESLFSDPKIASKIQSVEIVGFASPTYKGKQVGSIESRWRQPSGDQLQP